MPLSLAEFRPRGPMFIFFAGRSMRSESLPIGFMLLIDPEPELCKPGEESLAAVRIECWRVPWRRSMDRWKRIRTVHRFMWCFRFDGREIVRRRRVQLGVT